MKFTLSWLKTHLETDADVATICETLTRIGLEVEGLHDAGAALKGFSVAKIISAEQHPNADRLRVCMVDTGAGAPVQVVCGAPNARAGLVSVFSAPGTYIPGKDMTIAVGNVRGVESRGMLCSAAELELSEDHDGIMELPQDAQIGMAYAAYAGLNDPVIEINLTPNRPDAMGVYGIARDLAAAGLGTLIAPRAIKLTPKFASPVAVTLDFAADDKALCPAFALRSVRGVKNGASPEWMQRRLKAIGLRPINALVDMTNYMTFDQARPLHVFDADKVKGNLSVRRAVAGERLTALDHRDYTLDESMVVIADAHGVESIAGIMGGLASGCDENTTHVLIESALWEPLNIARSGRKLGLSSDARYRFERGIDPAYTLQGLDLATQMVLEMCGGEASEMALAGEVLAPKHQIDFPYTEVKRLTGLAVEQADMQAILERLGFGVSAPSAGVSRVIVPSYRPDVEGKADLVEEIIRIIGVDNVPAQPLLREDKVHAPVLTLLQKRARLAKRVMAGRGLYEMVSWSFVSNKQAQAFGGGASQLKLANPIASELSDMRPSLLPGLLSAAERNAARGFPDVALFEVGQVFLGLAPEQQKIAAAGLRRGTAKASGAGRAWNGKAEPVDVYDIKADCLALLSALGVATGGLQMVAGGEEFLHPGRSVRLQFGAKDKIGWFGEIHPKVLAALDISGPVVAFEIHLDALPQPKVKPTKTRGKLELSPLQPVLRDYAFVVDSGVEAETLLRIARNSDKALVEKVTLFDVFEGKSLGEGKKSLAIEVMLQPRAKTLTDQELEAFSAKLIAEVGKKTGGVLRA